MIIAIKANNSKVWHLTNRPPTYDRGEGPIQTLCGRGLSIPQTDRDGYHFDEMDTWTAFINHPEAAWQLCSKCGTLEDFMAASRERWAEETHRKEMQKEAQEKARQQAIDKANTLNEVWDQTLESLKAIGWQVGTPQHRRYTATMQINGFTFHMEFVRPDTAFGYNMSTGEVVEMIK